MSVSTRKEIISWIKHIVVACLLAVIMSKYVIVHANVPSGSMLETIQEKSKIIAFRLSYLVSDPKRGDIIVFKDPEELSTANPAYDKNAEPRLLVKRIIGLPNETLIIKDGLVYINDSEIPLDEPFLRNEPNGDFGPILIPEDCYFMMGDNRDNSNDSRAWTYDKFAHKKDILGKLVFSYYPVVRWY